MTTLNINDFFLSIGIVDTSCAGRTRMLNRILRGFYSMTTDLQRHNLIEPFNVSSNTLITTTYPIYKLQAFMAHGKSLSMRPVDSATQNTKGVLSWTQTYGDLYDNTWKYESDTEVRISSPDAGTLENANMKYARGPLTVVEADETFDVDAVDINGLEHLALKVYAEKEKDFNAAQYHSAEFMRRVERQKELEARIPVFVTSQYSSSL